MIKLTGKDQKKQVTIFKFRQLVLLLQSTEASYLPWTLWQVSVPGFMWSIWTYVLQDDILNYEIKIGKEQTWMYKTEFNRHTRFW